jgi:hypothetical protein
MIEYLMSKSIALDYARKRGGLIDRGWQFDHG